MLNDKLRQEAAIDTPSQIVTGRHRKERARVVVEAHGVVKAGRLERQLAETSQALWPVLEPPGGTESQGRVMTRKRRQLARVGALVQREDDQLQVVLIAEAIEQRLQSTDKVGGPRNVGAAVAAVRLEKAPVVIAKAAGMKLHHETILEAHARHLSQHLG